ncbi:uncharacterized protein [Asterias amurensis]|uniref:uncharacterized protein isoform X2 n=1 Tax=Asterias amurensis TaxID=7602 RepID=UPI003AB2790F
MLPWNVNLLKLVLSCRLLFYKQGTPYNGLEIVLDDVTLQLTRTASCCGSCSKSTHETTELVCKCDPFCVIYGDCCLDYTLFCTDIETGTSVNTLVIMDNCTNDQVNSSLTSEGEVSTSEDKCRVYAEEATHELVQEYLCQLRALWSPVILTRRSTQKIVRGHVRGIGKAGYAMIEDCRLGATEDELHACQMKHSLKSVQHLSDVIALLPVTAANGVHYMNIQCALCNGYDSPNVTFWTILFGCSPADLDLDFAFRRNISLVAKNCFVKAVFEPTSFPWEVAPFRLSFRSDQCNDSPNWDACRAYRLPNNDSANIHCSLCLAADRAGRNYTTGPPNNRSDTDAPEYPGPLPISALFDFSPLEGAGISRRGYDTTFVKPTCDHGQIYEQSTGECRDFFCPFGQIVADDGFTCVSLRNKSNYSLRFDTQVSNGRFSCEVFIQTEFPVDDKKAFSSILFHQILGDVSVESTELKPDDSNKTHPNQSCSRIKMPYPYILFALTQVSNTTSIESVSELVLDALNKTKCWEFTNMSLSVSTVRIRNFDQVLLQDQCAKQGQELDQFVLDVYQRFLVERVSYIEFSLGNETYVLPSLRTRQEITHTAGKQTGLSVLTCSVKLICPIIVLDLTEYNVTMMGSMLMYRDAAGRNLSSSDVIMMSQGKIAVCYSDTETSNYPQIEYDTSEIILSMVGISISLVFLAMSLFTYYMFPELRNLPGKNMMSFLVALFALLVTFLIAVGSPLSQLTLGSKASCLTFAVLIHYFLMAVFFWSNIISLHFVRTFGLGVRMRFTGLTNDGRVFRLYSLYGWGAPIVVVGVGCLLHFFAELSGQRENVYSGCMISGGEAAIYLVAIPLSCLMFLNAVFFTVTLVGIRKSRKDVKLVRKKKGRLETFYMELSLFVKTFVATGLLWLGIFIVGYFEDRAFSYVITVIFTLQGPMSFFAFAFTERVRGMWAKKISSATSRPGQSSTDVSKVSATSRETMVSEWEVDPPEMETQFTQAVITSNDGSKSGCVVDNPLCDDCESVK